MIPSAILSLSLLFQQCAPEISPVTLDAIVKTESSGNPFAVANIDDRISRSFSDKASAIRYINTLSKEGKKFSAGLMQIYSGNFKALGLDNNTVFDACENIKAGAKILRQNYEKAKGDSEQERLDKAISMYYSGNEFRGLKKEAEYSNTSYVERVRNKAYKVPALKPQQERESRSAIIDKPLTHSSKTNSWDLFGDFENE
ncbi:lytic transglycosylase domain-containing protein [Plesiomonas sp. PI-19]|uniref:lytic transglycosylase domain-containing protein n=1 Tax=Plesiomonas sp. PI-19 TaxID=2898798 RepID=UPI001F1608CA|nr:lytic transglycosylase domain-containing protein [Plesiomonas sp. PI-19]MCE5165621.1 lytic transglycosylase domain-containing protein [Plesiomonas sp. PI-19]